MKQHLLNLLNKYKDMIICPFCGYNYDDDCPSISEKTFIYMVLNKFPTPKTSCEVFEDIAIRENCDVSYIGGIKMLCYRCDEPFLVEQKVVYSMTKIDIDKKIEDQERG